MVKLGAGSEMEGISYQLEAVYNEQIVTKLSQLSQDIAFSSLPLRKVGSLGSEDRTIIVLKFLIHRFGA